MSSQSIHIHRQLVTKGWAVFDSESASDTRRALREFGEVVSRERIPHQPDVRTKHVEDKILQVHSGHPVGRWICWHCVTPDPLGGAILLNPVWLPVLGMSAETKQALRELTMGVPGRRGEDAELCPVLRNLGPQAATPSCEAIFFQPWFWREGANEHLDALVAKMKAQGNDRVRLSSGQALLVDNARVLHGFEPTAEWRQTLLIRHRLWGSFTEAIDEWE